MKKLFNRIKKILKKDNQEAEQTSQVQGYPVKNFLTAEKLIELKKTLNYNFKNEGYFEQALTHRSFLQITSKGVVSNERLEFLGDSILNMLVGEAIFNIHKDWHEGQMTKLRSRLVSRKALTHSAHKIGLHRFMLLNESAEQSLFQGNDSLLADALEAIIAAIYLDSGYELDEPRAFLNRTVLHHSTMKEIQNLDTNFKSVLLEYIQSIGAGAPYYEVLEQEGPDHERVFTIAVYVSETIKGKGKGRSKKEAEQFAAAEAVKNLGIEIHEDLL